MGAAAASLVLAGIAAASGVHAAVAPPASGVVAQMTIAGINKGAPTTILSFSLGATDAPGTEGGGSGKVSFANLAVSKVLDADSVPLLQAAATGQRLSRVTIELFNGKDTTPFATYAFEDAIVTSNVIGAANASTSEQDTFGFRRITSDVTINGQLFHNCFDVNAGGSC
jgi:type VI protein secretion system component Hcp